MGRYFSAQFLVEVFEVLEKYHRIENREVISKTTLPAVLISAMDVNHAVFRYGEWLERQFDAPKLRLFDKYDHRTNYTDLIMDVTQAATGPYSGSFKKVKVISRNYTFGHDTEPDIVVVAELTPSKALDIDGISICKSVASNDISGGVATILNMLDTQYVAEHGKLNRNFLLKGSTEGAFVKLGTIDGIVGECRDLREAIDAVTHLIPGVYNGPNLDKRKESSQLAVRVYLRTSVDGQYTKLPDDLRLNVFDKFIAKHYE